MASIDPDTLRALLKVRRRRALLLIGLHLGCWVGAGVAIAGTDHLPLKILLWVLAGSGVMGLIQLDHESWHHNLFRSRWADRLFGEVLSLLVGIAYLPMRHDHLLHHRWPRTPLDPDAYNAGRRSPGLMLLFYGVVLLGLPLSLIYFNVLYPLQHFDRAALRRHWFVIAGYAGVYAGVLSLLAHHDLLGLAVEVWLIPILVASPLNGLKSIADHHANTWRGDRFHTATTTRSNRVISFLWCGLNYHLDHHLYPRVPGYNLPALHRHLRGELRDRDAPVFDSYIRVMIAALRAGPAIVEDDVTLVSVRRRAT